MKRTLLAVGVAAAVLLATTAGTARADSAIHNKFSFSGGDFFPAGTLCDFTYEDTFTVVVNATVAPNGVNPVEFTEYVTHTNVDTGYSLTEVGHFEQLGGPSTVMNAGIFWHLRDASGHNVVVKAGEATFDLDTGALISFTPNSAADQTFAQVICPALGGSPA